ncbi:MAG: hypothetical protein CVU81_01545 [Euryarchaeota archaeon HGW-Euryarchaeota-1]|nr:MAG: hypothetical protein CVU81_01545 [Euryarchaeota archaeon HGW-Euryarchaeota-1]
MGKTEKDKNYRDYYKNYRDNTCWDCCVGDHRDHVMGGIILITIGTIFMLSEFGMIENVGRLWPLILIVIGLGLLFKHFVKKE